MMANPRNTFSLRLALFLSRQKQAAQHILQPFWSYQLLVEQEPTTTTTTLDGQNVTLSVMYSDDEHAVNPPHITQTFSSLDALILFLDRMNVPYERWFPLESTEDEDQQKEKL